MKTALKGKFITEKSFYWNLLAIAGPMAFQYAISFGVTLMDSVMLGSLGDVAISGANLGNQMQTLVMSCSFGLASGGGVLIAQYWGKKDMVHIRKVVRLTIQAVFLSVSVLTLLALAFPQQILHIFTPDAEVIEAGASYLSLVAFSYLPYALASCYLSSLRGTEQVKMTVGIYGCSFFVNVFFNYIFIFGKLGAPALGVRGAAVGTICARCSELILALVYMYTKEKLVGFRVKDCFTWDNELLGEYFRHSLPVVGNELLWGFGSTVTNIIMGQIGRTFVAASSITMVLHPFSFVTLNGVGNAAAVLTGRTVGEGSYARVRRVANTLVAISFGLGAVNSLFILCVRPLFLSMYHVTPAVHDAAYSMIGVLALLQLVMGVELTCIVGVLRGGGDTRLGFLFDCGTLWLASIPLGFFTGLVLHWPVPAVYACLKIDSPLKVVLSLIRIKGGHWVRNVTVQEDTPSAYEVEDVERLREKTGQ